MDNVIEFYCFYFEVKEIAAKFVVNQLKLSQIWYRAMEEYGTGFSCWNVLCKKSKTVSTTQKLLDIIHNLFFAVKIQKQPFSASFKRIKKKEYYK